MGGWVGGWVVGWLVGWGDVRVSVFMCVCVGPLHMCLGPCACVVRLRVCWVHVGGYWREGEDASRVGLLRGCTGARAHGTWGGMSPSLARLTPTHAHPRTCSPPPLPGLALVIGMAQFTSFKGAPGSARAGEWIDGTEAIWAAVICIVAFGTCVLFPKITDGGHWDCRVLLWQGSH